MSDTLPPAPVSKLSEKIDQLLKLYFDAKNQISDLQKMIEEKDKRIKELEDKFLEIEIYEEDLISKIESALNNNGI